MSPRRAFYVTTPIYYVNDLPHIGHIYTTIVADALARYHRLAGDEVHFLTGADEHGLKIQRAAAERGVAPQQLADEVVENYRRLWPALGVSNDDLIRTTEERHQRGVAALFAAIRAQSPEAIYRGLYRGWYCAACESHYPESQLVDGGCPDAGHRGRPVEPIAETSWFFRLSAYEAALLQLYEEHPEFVRPDRRLNEVRAFVGAGLRDLSISRSRAQVAWGIPFPGDPEQTVYVWFDALTNYISALGFGAPGAAPLYERFWAADRAHRTVLHVVGKDILRFHAVYWPAFLMAAGAPLPTTVLGHGWWLKDEAKISKSVGNVVRPEPLLADYGADALRWFLLREIPLGLDGSFSDEALVERANADLANNIGNLFSRVAALVAKLPGGRTPAAEPLFDDPLGEAARGAPRAYDASFARHDPAGALRALADWADALNKYLVRHEPWRRSGRADHCDRALRTAMDQLAHIALRLHPPAPHAAARLWATLGLPDDPAALIGAGENLLAREAWPVVGAVARAGEAAFPRLHRCVVPTAGSAAPMPGAKENAVDQTSMGAPAGVALIERAEFAKVSLRVAQVVACEQHPNADKLLRLEIDLGDERRQIIAGIAQAYRPEQLIGRRLIVVTNLRPVKLRGLESQGMLLAATGPDGVPRVLVPDGDVPPGSKVS